VGAPTRRFAARMHSHARMHAHCWLVLVMSMSLAAAASSEKKRRLLHLHGGLQIVCLSSSFGRRLDTDRSPSSYLFQPFVEPATHVSISFGFD